MSLRSFSGLLTARFLLHLRTWEHKASGVNTSTNISTIGAFNHDATSTVASAVAEAFGSDPVARAAAGKLIMEDSASPTQSLKSDGAAAERTQDNELHEERNITEEIRDIETR